MNKKKLYCSNCNKYGHTNKECPEPITSAGVICMDLNFKMKEYFKKNYSNDINIYNYQRLSNIDKIKKYKNRVRFLMVQRKHSLNYINFIRGIYDENNFNELEKMFKLMSNQEIQLIKDSLFEDLWNDLWVKTARKKVYQKEFNQSKIKFNKIKELSQMHNLFKIYSEYETPEWEFPKGRKNINESNFDCAMREFKEETGIDKNQIEIINNFNSIHDNFIGTNGLNYKHIFYIGFLNDKITDYEITSKNEILEVKWCLWDEALRLIRPYSINKINILNKLFLFFINICEDNNTNLLENI